MAPLRLHRGLLLIGQRATAASVMGGATHDVAVFGEGWHPVMSIEDPRERLIALANAYVEFGVR